MPSQGRQSITHLGTVRRKEGPSASGTITRPPVTSRRNVLRCYYRLRLYAAGLFRGLLNES
jgi:hypothetical protein